MPIIKLKHIVSFSSEDPAHPSDNLLKSETYRKWQCADPSDKQASVIVELEKASKINSLDIGNNGSAFVEVLVGRSSTSEYQVLLVASSFMSPTESKNGTNNNRVRMFGFEKLSKTVAEQKWDRVKLVCTQPYNKTSRYGLSFVNFHSPESAEKNRTPMKTQKKLGAFVLKDEEEDTITSGSLFAKRKEKTEASSSQAKSTAAELREASKHPAAMATTSMTKLSFKPESIERKKSSETVSSNEKVQPPAKKTKVAESSSREQENSINSILKDVVFVLSGFKNPLRSQLRDKATSMGARYRGDWDKTCTHLICAFINTPKYCQVKETRKGKIVSQSWLDDCLRRKKRLPEKRYRLRGDDTDSGSTTEEEEMPIQRKDKDHPSTSHADNEVSTSRTSTSSQKTTSESTTTIVIRDGINKIDHVDEGTEPPGEPAEPLDDTEPLDNTEVLEDEFQDNAENIEDQPSSGHDTEDEIRAIRAKKCDEEDPYECSTEYETDDDDNEKLMLKDKTPVTAPPSVDLLNLPDFFSKKTFFLHGTFDSEERRTIARYITAYDGEVEEYMSDKVTYVITDRTWDDDFDEALVDNSSLRFVRPKWIYSCHEKRSFVPFQPFIVVPR